MPLFYEGEVKKVGGGVAGGPGEFGSERVSESSGIMLYGKKRKWRWTEREG